MDLDNQGVFLIFFQNPFSLSVIEVKFQTNLKFYFDY